MDRILFKQSDNLDRFRQKIKNNACHDRRMLWGSDLMPHDVRITVLFEAKDEAGRWQVPRNQFLEREFRLPVRQVERRSMETAYRFRDPRLGHIDILSFADKLWWPMYFDGSQQAATLAELRSKLADGHFDLLGLNPILRCGRPTAKLNVCGAGPLSQHEIEGALNRARQKLHENILICDGTAFARGGEPLYFPRAAPGSPGAHFVNSGAGRAIDPDDNMRWQPGDFSDKLVQSRFRNGRFRPAREAGYFGTDDRSSPIEIMAGAPQSVDRFEIRIDACLRELRKLVDAPAWAINAMSLTRRGRVARREAFGRLEADIRTASTSEHQPNRFRATLVRADALQQFVCFVERSYWDLHRRDLAKECRNALADFDRAECKVRADAFSPLAAEDDRARALPGMEGAGLRARGDIRAARAPSPV
jgi:hypothetical protein